MGVCQRCGYEEPPIWKNRMYQLYQQYCHIEEIESWNQTRELAATLRKEGACNHKFDTVTYSDGIYNYQFRHDGFVIRILKKLAKQPNSMREPDREKSKIKQLRNNQTRLLEDFK